MKHLINSYNTTSLTLSIMRRVATRLNLDIDNDGVADKLYDICSDLEDWPEDEGFGSSDAYSYIKEAARVFNIDLAA
jgi:hypothetical protein